MEQGLLTGLPFETTPECAWILGFYPTNPVFLAQEGSIFLEAIREFGPRPQVELHIQEEGLTLVADLASLADHGAVLRGQAMRWERTPPDVLVPFLDRRREIPIRRLLNAADAACTAAIEATGTAACIHAIRPERLSAMSPDFGVEEPQPWRFG